MINVNTILETYPTHLQGEAWLYATKHDKLPSLKVLLRRYGKPNTVGSRDIERHSVTLLSKLYVTVAKPIDDQSELDASYAIHCRLAKLVGENVVRDLAHGYSIREAARRNAIHRNTINNAVKRIRQDF